MDNRQAHRTPAESAAATGPDPVACHYSVRHARELVLVEQPGEPVASPDLAW